MSKKDDTRKRLEATIALLLDAHPCAMRVLLGQFPFPGPDDISILMSACPKTVRILYPGPGAERLTLTEEFNAIIEDAGGWPRIVEVTRTWGRDNPREWGVTVDYHVWSCWRRPRMGGSALESVARKWGASLDAITQIARAFPGELARTVM
jgi:hypothetical protein